MTLSGGTAVGTLVKSGGTLNAAGGVDSGAVISIGGSALVLSGGTDVDVTVLAGGLELVSSGGTANGTIVSNGGVLDGVVGRDGKRRAG